MKNNKKAHSVFTLMASAAVLVVPFTAQAFDAPVPGYIPPVSMETVPAYADDTRGVYVPSHTQHRLKGERELQNYQLAQYGGEAPVYAQDNPPTDQYERELNKLSNGYGNVPNELDRIAQDPGLLNGGTPNPYAQVDGQPPQYAQEQQYSGAPVMQGAVPPMAPGYGYPSAQPYPSYPNAPYGTPTVTPSNTPSGGVELLVGQPGTNVTVDMHNALVRIAEDRISVRRAVQRMMDQIGAGDWTVVWDLNEQNMALPEMEISLYAEEPFINVLNALLAKIQTRSGQPLRVIRYDKVHRLVITDRATGHKFDSASPVGVGPDAGPVAITENVLKESMVSLHYDEIPLVDALENIVNQAGKGEWRLRMYAGLDQTLKPAHIEEPFAVALERLLKLFNLKYEIFPGGKLIVVTHNSRFGFKGSP